MAARNNIKSYSCAQTRGHIKFTIHPKWCIFQKQEMREGRNQHVINF